MLGILAPLSPFILIGTLIVNANILCWVAVFAMLAFVAIGTILLIIKAVTSIIATKKTSDYMEVSKDAVETANKVMESAL